MIFLNKNLPVKLGLGFLFIFGFWPFSLFAGVVINEIMYHPASLSDEDEFIELYNSTTQTVDLSGWKLRKGVDYTFPAGTLLAPGAFAVVSPSPEAFLSHYGKMPVLGPYSGHLANDGETLELMDAAGNTADQVKYRDEEGWPVVADGLGPSLERIHPDMDSSFSQTWQAGPKGGTPGQVNQSAIPKPLPIVYNVRQTPAQPKSSETVHITGQVTHSRPVPQVLINYKPETATVFSQTMMWDDGKHQDGAAGDGTYAGEIPAFANGSIIEFFIEVKDDLNVAGRFPLEAPSRRAFYLVDDAVYEASLPLYRAVMRAADNKLLRSRDPFSDDELDASFIFNNDMYYDVGLRFRGKGARSAEPKSYRINFSQTRNFGQIRKLNLNGINIERQYIGFEAFKRARLPIQEKQFVSLVFNRTFVPSYLQVERSDGDMVTRVFGNGKGNLYHGLEQANLDYRGEKPDPYRVNYVKKTNKLEDDYSDLIRLCDTFSNSPDATFPTELAKQINVWQWMHWFAVKTVLNDREGGLSNDRGDEFFLYRYPADNLFYLLPWDFEDTLREPIFPIHHHGTPAVQRFLRHPDLARLYYEAILNVLNLEIPQETMDAIIDQTAPVVDEKRRADLKAISRRIRAFLLANIPTALTVQVQAGSSSAKISLAGENDSWRYFKGKEAPSAGALDWTLPTFDDSNWSTGVGAFGYADIDHKTTLDDMRNNYTSFYIRKTFDVADPAKLSELTLSVVIDDGFIAYLNGVEIARYNVTGIPLFNSRAAATVEVGAPMVYTFNNPSVLLKAGKNTLAVVGLNVTPDSSDFSLDVRLEASTVDDKIIQMRGAANAANTRWVTINGAPCNFIPWKVQWDYTGTLIRGKNSFRIEALNADRQIIDATTVVIYKDVAEPTDAIEIAGNEIWTPSQNPFTLNKTLVIPKGDSLTIQPGVIVRFAPNAGIVVYGSLAVAGAATETVRFEPATAGNACGGIAVDAAEGPTTISYADFSAIRSFSFRGKDFPAAVTILDSTVVVDHCRFSGASSLGIEGVRSFLDINNNRFEAMEEAVHCNICYAQVENNTFLNIHGYNDAIDFDDQLGPPSIIRGNLIDGSGDDGIDIGYASPRIEGNRIAHCRTDDPARGPSKGISLEGTSTPVLINNVILQCDIGVAVKDRCDTEFIHNTIVSCTTGISLYEKNAGKGGGIAAIQNCVVWDTQQSLFADEKSTYTAQSSDWMQIPVGLEKENFSRDPLFTDWKTGNFIPLWGSPLIDAAIPTEVRDDIRGLTRPLGEKPDIGAYEYDPSTPILNWSWYD